MPSREPNQLIDHVSDGIREYDNPMPAWWLGIFYATVAFTVVFVPYLHFADWSQIGQYEAEVAAAEARHEPALDAPTGRLGDPTAGAAVFRTNCVACHGADARGGIGPDLTDTTWIHGGTMPEIRQTIMGGVVEKGMLAWGPVLGDAKVADVAAYVHALGGGR